MHTRLATILLCSAVALTGCEGFDRESRRARAAGNGPVGGGVLAMPPPPADVRLGEAGTLLDRLIEEDRFHRFLALVQRAGALPRLRGEPALIIIAPTDEAFARLSPEAWVALFNDPARARRFVAAHLRPMPRGPRPLRAVDPTLVARRDLRATNGVILVTDHLRIDRGP